MKLDLVKFMIVLFLVGNAGWMIYNGYSLYDRKVTHANEQEKVQNLAVKVRKTALDFESDIDHIIRGSLKPVRKVNVYLDEQAKRAQIFPQRDGLRIPLKTDVSNKRHFVEESWRLTFSDRQKLFSLRQIADFCTNIETASPGFQIKEVDFGQRSVPGQDPIWGKDQWRPGSIVVRRLAPKAKDT